MKDTNKTTQKKKKKSKGILKYIISFSIAFIVGLFGMSQLVKSYSPKVDVEIGNNEALTLSEKEIDVEIKTIDERLRWIKMEDEMPSVAIRNTEIDESELKKNKKQEEKEKKEKKFSKAPIPTEEDLRKVKIDFRYKYNDSNNIQLPLTVAPTTNKTTEQQEEKYLTKVYIGSFTSIEEAMEMQKKVAGDIQGVVPFIKSIDGNYIVQIGSFSDNEKATLLVENMKEKGYTPKTKKEKQ